MSKHALVMDLAAAVVFQAHKIPDAESFSISLGMIDPCNRKARALFPRKDY